MGLGVLLSGFLMKMPTWGNRTKEHVRACVSVCVCVCVCVVSVLGAECWGSQCLESHRLRRPPLHDFCTALSAQVTCSQMLALCLLGPWQVWSLRETGVNSNTHAFCSWWAPRGWALLLVLLWNEQVNWQPDLLVTRPSWVLLIWRAGRVMIGARMDARLWPCKLSPRLLGSWPRRLCVPMSQSPQGPCCS